MIRNLFAGSRQTKQYRRRNSPLLSLWMATGLEVLELRQMLSAISWVGGATGNWNVTSNWSLNRLPNNTDQVTIDPGTPTTVRILAGDSFQVSSLTTGADDTLTFTDGQLSIGATSTLSGPLTMTGGTLVANSGAVVTVNGATTVSGGSLFANNGAHIDLPMLTSETAPSNKPSTFQADGLGSLIDLGSLTTITNQSNGNFSVTASNGGEIDLSALTTVSNISGNFSMTSREKDINGKFSNIDVSSLTAVGGTGNTLTVQNGGTIEDANLHNWVNGTITVNGGTYNFSNFTNINTSTVLVNASTVANLPNPGVLTLPNITTYTSTVPSGNGRKFQANGDDSQLNFPALTSVSNTGGGTVEPSALNGGRVDLPALTSVVNTNGLFNITSIGTADDSSPSVLNISNLPNFAGTGNVLTVQDSGVIQFGTITSWINNTINVSGGIYTFSNLTNINTSSVNVTNGGSLTLPNITSYTSTVASGNGRLLRAEGALSALKLPALVTITNTGGGAINPQALNGGLVDLPALTTVTNTNGTFNPDSESADGQGNPSIINISNLGNFAGASNVLTLKSGGIVQFNNVTSWINNFINVSGGVYSLGNLTNVNVSSISVNNGGSLTLPNITTYTSTVSSGNGRQLTAEGALSVLSFPALTTISNTGGGAINPLAQNGGKVDLPALTSVVNTNGTFNPDSEGTDGQGNPSILNIANLANYGGTSNVLTVKNQGVINFGTITTWNNNFINVSGSAYTFSNLTSVNNTTITVNNHGSLSLPNVVTITNNVTSGNGRQIQADGSNSSLSFPGLTTINVQGGGNFEPRATNGGFVNLPALTSVVVTNGQFNPYADGKDNVGTPSEISIANLTTVSGAGSSNLRSLNGALITLSDLSNLNGSTMNIDVGAGSEVAGPSGSIVWPLANSDGASVTIPAFPTGVKLFLNASTYSNMTINDSVSTPVVLEGGTFTGTTTLNLGAAATLDLTGGITTTYSGNLNGTGDGTATLVSGNLQAGSGGLTLNLLDDMFQWTGGNINSAQGNLTNAGGITVGGGNSRQIIGGDPVTNTGSITLTGGTSLTVSDNVDSSDGDITVSPGSTLTVQGTLTFSSLSLLKVQVAGNSGTAVFGKLAPTGAATLAGPLNVELIGGFVPAGGTTMNFLTAASLSGSFSPVSNVTGGGSSVAFTAANTAPGVETLTVVGATAPVMAVKGNSQAIVDGTLTTSANNNTAFGNSNVGTPISKTFTISNSAGATASLTLGQVSITGTNEDDFTVTSQPASSVAAGGSTTFTIRFNPSEAGSRTATVSFTENDPAQSSPFTFAISGDGNAVLSGLSVTGNGQAIQDGATTTSAANNTAFGSTQVGTFVSQTYTISNAANASSTLAIGTVSLIQPNNPGEFTVTTQPATSLAPGASTTFTIKFQPAASGNRTATISFTEDAPGTVSPFTFAIDGTGTASATSPVIVVTGNGQAIVDGATSTSFTNNTNFGQTAVKKGVSTPITQTFTITNSANATGALHLGTISIGGTNPDDFTVVTQPASTVAPGATTTFTIRYQPEVIGPSRAVVSFSEDDPGVSTPFTFAISGEGVKKVVAAKTTTTLTSNPTNPSPGSETTLTARVTVAVSGTPIPTGVITFKKGSTILGTGTLTVVGGQAQVSIVTTQLTAGTNSLSAVFDGTSALKKSTGKLKIKISS